MSENLLSIQNLKKNFPIREGIFGQKAAVVSAVQDVSFDLKEGETLGLVGESGCGKSTLGRCIVRLLEPSSGKIIFQGQDISDCSGSELRILRKKMQIVFQDPYASLNPRRTVGAAIEEPLLVHKLFSSEKDRKDRVTQLCEMVGLRTDQMERYGSELSGGQRQRVGIARALAVEPKLLVCDEPVSALDVSIQAQVINLLMDLQQKLGLTYIFIAHDLKVVEHVSNRVAVMYLGKIVEIANARDLYNSPLHPYTKALFSSIPVANPRAKEARVVLRGEVPSPLLLPTGCNFHTRCPIATEECKKQAPSLVPKKQNHLVSCFQV